MIGMLLTPPDVISQVLLAIPVWLLFELGLVLSRTMVSSKSHSEEDESISEGPDKKEPRFGPLTDEEHEVELNETELLNDPEQPTD